MNWKEEIKKFNLPHAKIMYMIYYFHKKNLLSDKEKLKLKEIVILESEVIFNTIEDFENIEDDENKEDYLLNELKDIYKEEKRYLKKKSGPINQITTPGFQKNEMPKIFINEITNNMGNMQKGDFMSSNINIESHNNQVFINVINSSPQKSEKHSNESSPIGKQLISKKKQNHLKIKKTDKSNNGGGSLISEEIKQCKLGMSPKITFGRPEKKKVVYNKTPLGQAISKIEREKKNY